MPATDAITTEAKDMVWWNWFLQRHYYGVHEKEWASVVRSVWRAAELRAGDAVLELGSGNGQLIIGLARNGAVATGVDMSGDLTSACAGRAMREGIATARFVCHDMFSYAPDFVPDCIISANTSFGFGSDAQNRGLMESMGRWLKPGGRLYLDVCTSDAAQQIGAWTDRVNGGTLYVNSTFDTGTGVVLNDPRWVSPDGSVCYTAVHPEIVQLYSRAQIQEMLLNAGLKPKRLKRAMGRWFDQTDDQMQTTWVATKM